MAFYDGTKLLSLQDINGDKPEIYLCTTNRSGGKTTYFSRLITNKYLDGKGKFMLLYRFNYELDDVAEKFFKDINALFFPKYAMRSERRANGIYHELYLGSVQEAAEEPKKYGESCGYAVALNSADQIKKNSHFFSDVERMFFDEFQSETNHYCTNEIRKLLSIHTSVARGSGKQSRYVPVYMCSNPVSIINPYYVELGISTRLQKNTKFLRGVGFVLEHGFVESASKAQMESAFNRAFASNDYVDYAAQAVYLNDNMSFIEKMKGKSKYMATLKYQGTEFGVRAFVEDGVIYCDDRPDLSFNFKLSVTTDDHNINYVMLRQNDAFINSMRYFFDRGCFRFKNLKCKEAILKALSY